MSEDRTITCSDCNQTFTFTAEEQSFYAERGFQEPKRCKPCRESRKARGPGGRGGGGGGGGGGGRDRGPRGDRPPKQMFPATCAECGKATEVPFEPKSDRPVYCKDCFKTIRERGGGGRE
ncbi:zinc-ribbon domain containing protein [bacterium]|nr:zinc-ribbon domain containing protein [bacterium]